MTADLDFPINKFWFVGTDLYIVGEDDPGIIRTFKISSAGGIYNPTAAVCVSEEDLEVENIVEF